MTRVLHSSNDSAVSCSVLTIEADSAMSKTVYGILLRGILLSAHNRGGLPAMSKTVYGI